MVGEIDRPRLELRPTHGFRRRSLASPQGQPQDLRGAPREHFELRALGVRCASKRVARLMREAGFCSGAAAGGGKPRYSRVAEGRIPPAPDLV